MTAQSPQAGELAVIAEQFGLVIDGKNVRSKFTEAVTLEDFGKLVAALSQPTPAAQALTDERIDHIVELTVKGMPEGILGFMKAWGWRQFARNLAEIIAVPTSGAPAAQAGWLPIETAPKDGTGMLALWVHSGGIVTARNYALVEFVRGCWRDTESDDQVYTEPTHWMPLPAAPGSVSAAPAAATTCGWPDCDCESPVCKDAQDVARAFVGGNPARSAAPAAVSGEAPYPFQCSRCGAKIGQACRKDSIVVDCLECGNVWARKPVPKGYKLVEDAPALPAVEGRKPLTGGQIENGRREHGGELFDFTAGVRFAERAHGIGGD